MKNNLFFILPFLLLTVACKKDRICVCKVTDNSAGGNSTYDVTYTLKDVSKNSAKTNCVDYEVKSTTTGETITYDCSLKN